MKTSVKPISIVVKWLFLCLLFFVVFFVSCKKNTNEYVQPTIDYTYFPIDTGKYFIYQVEKIEIDSAMNYYDTVRYQLKTVYDSYFIDAEGNTALRLERYKRNNSGLNWAVSDVWYANLKTSSAQVVEENRRFVKIVFPVELNQTWNGNAYNSLESEFYTITGMHEPYKVGSLQFDSVLTVTQLYDTTLLYKYYKAEKYEKNVGLIYKIEMNLESQNITFPNVLVENRITSGTIYTQKLIEYGNE